MSEPVDLDQVVGKHAVSAPGACVVVAAESGASPAAVAFEV